MLKFQTFKAVKTSSFKGYQRKTKVFSPKLIKTNSTLVSNSNKSKTMNHQKPIVHCKSRKIKSQPFIISLSCS